MSSNSVRRALNSSVMSLGSLICHIHILLLAVASAGEQIMWLPPGVPGSPVPLFLSSEMVIVLTSYLAEGIWMAFISSCLEVVLSNSGRICISWMGSTPSGSK